ncbi:ParA family protein [Pseudoduganella ginsengisoli]|uniref:AAA family ATPase n=1 Tax=Pseudoduganella ginsengisoli TaxID=1462440 RepID=A0A6L6Q9I7_9BURK|nr:ParA family protein [Pseudoduganella ginsengisoli]MTW05861.1 AAA family ATPase [Pseudoduganella ginsengisoli]
MKISTVAVNKGGVGKTATAVHLAFAAAERQVSTVFLDLDEQGNSTYTLGAHLAEGISATMLFTPDGANEIRAYFAAHPVKPGITLIGSDDVLKEVDRYPVADIAQNFMASIKALAEAGFDLCLVDTPNGGGSIPQCALAVSDYVLSPVEVEHYSIQGIRKLVTTIGNIKFGNIDGLPANPNLHWLGMLPNKVDLRNPRHVTNLAALKAEHNDYVVPLTVGLRSTIADAVASCVPVWKIKKTTARLASSEVRAVANYVFETMEIN